MILESVIIEANPNNREMVMRIVDPSNEDKTIIGVVEFEYKSFKGDYYFILYTKDKDTGKKDFYTDTKEDLDLTFNSKEEADEFIKRCKFMGMVITDSLDEEEPGKVLDISDIKITKKNGFASTNVPQIEEGKPMYVIMTRDSNMDYRFYWTYDQPTDMTLKRTKDSFDKYGYELERYIVYKTTDYKDIPNLYYFPSNTYYIPIINPVGVYEVNGQQISSQGFKVKKKEDKNMLSYIELKKKIENLEDDKLEQYLSSSKFKDLKKLFSQMDWYYTTLESKDIPGFIKTFDPDNKLPEEPKKGSNEEPLDFTGFDKLDKISNPGPVLLELFEKISEETWKFPTSDTFYFTEDYEDYDKDLFDEFGIDYEGLKEDYDRKINNIKFDDKLKQIYKKLKYTKDTYTDKFLMDYFIKNYFVWQKSDFKQNEKDIKFYYKDPRIIEKFMTDIQNINGIEYKTKFYLLKGEDKLIEKFIRKIISELRS